MVAACSLENDAVLTSLGVRTTTNPNQLPPCEPESGPWSSSPGRRGRSTTTPASRRTTGSASPPSRGASPHPAPKRARPGWRRNWRPWDRTLRETYGPWLAELGLSEAIERGILAGFEIDILEIHDPSPILGESEEARRGRRLALLQTALLEHAAAYNLRTVMTYHQKVEEAAAFAEKLPKTAAELYARDAADEDLAAACRRGQGR